MKKVIYLDNASTSFPKPPCVLQGIEDYFSQIGLNPYRSSGKRGKRAQQLIEKTREQLAELIHAEDRKKISFTHNATYALNMLLKGILKKGDHVIFSNFEHNATFRPLYKLERAGKITTDLITSNADGEVHLSDIEEKIRPHTRLIVWNHASNVLGVLSPLEEIGKLAKRYGVLFLVDCAQTAGIVELNVKKSEIDFLAGTGHKSLLAPSGVGFLYARDSEWVDTLIEGGGGLNSTYPMHPNAMPYKFEAGTVNYLGIAGLERALSYLSSHFQEIHEREYKLLDYLLAKLKELENVTIYGTQHLGKKVPLVSFNMEEFFPQELSFILEEKFSILTRSGLHCSPLIHETIQTIPSGVVRVSLGYQNTKQDIDALIEALYAIRKHKRQNSAPKLARSRASGT